jgi:hypothetical protein
MAAWEGEEKDAIGWEIVRTTECVVCVCAVSTWSLERRPARYELLSEWHWSDEM